MLDSKMSLILLTLALLSLLADPCLGAAVNKVYSDPGCQTLVAEYRTVKNFSPCFDVTCLPFGSQWVSFSCEDELNSTFEGHPTTAVFYSDGSCNQIREMVALFSSDVTCINLAIGASFSVTNNCNSKTIRNVVFGIYASLDCSLTNFGNVTTTETCVKDGGASDVVTCASSGPTNTPPALISVPVAREESQAKENSGTAARVVQISQILTFTILCIIYV